MFAIIISSRKFTGRFIALHQEKSWESKSTAFMCRGVTASQCTWWYMACNEVFRTSIVLHLSLVFFHWTVKHFKTNYSLYPGHLLLWNIRTRPLSFHLSTLYHLASACCDRPSDPSLAASLMVVVIVARGPAFVSNDGDDYSVSREGERGGKRRKIDVMHHQSLEEKERERKRERERERERVSLSILRATVSQSVSLFLWHDSGPFVRREGKMSKIYPTHKLQCLMGETVNVLDPYICVFS